MKKLVLHDKVEFLLKTITELLILMNFGKIFSCEGYMNTKELHALNRTWWKEATAYQIYPRSFMDSNGDGVGDLQESFLNLIICRSLASMSFGSVLFINPQMMIMVMIFRIIRILWRSSAAWPTLISCCTRFMHEA